MKRGESPNHAGPSQTAAHLMILGDVDGVVKAYKSVAWHLAIHRLDGDEQPKANPEIEARFAHRARPIPFGWRWFAPGLAALRQSEFPFLILKTMPSYTRFARSWLRETICHRERYYPPHAASSASVGIDDQSDLSSVHLQPQRASLSHCCV